MGVSVEVQGLRECRLRRLGNPVVLLFSHVSTLDAMIILSTFPEAFCAVVKVRLVALLGGERGSMGGRERRAGTVSAFEVISGWKRAYLTHIDGRAQEGRDGV